MPVSAEWIYVSVTHHSIRSIIQSGTTFNWSLNQLLQIREEWCQHWWPSKTIFHGMHVKLKITSSSRQILNKQHCCEGFNIITSKSRNQNFLNFHLKIPLFFNNLAPSYLSDLPNQFEQTLRSSTCLLLILNSLALGIRLSLERLLEVGTLFSIELGNF